MREAFGYASIEWKKGIDWDAVRTYRLDRAQAAMQRHGLGSMLLMYDENIRYVTSTLTPGCIVKSRMYSTAVRPSPAAVSFTSAEYATNPSPGVIRW